MLVGRLYVRVGKFYVGCRVVFDYYFCQSIYDVDKVLEPRD